MNVIEALQLYVCVNSNEIQGKYSVMHSGTEEFWTEKHEFQTALLEQKSGIMGQGRRSRCGEWRVRSVSLFEGTVGCSDRSRWVYTAAFDQLMSQRRNVTGYVKRLFDQHDEAES